MSLDMIFKITAIGIIVAVADMVLKKAGRDDIASVVTIAGLVIVIMMVVSSVTDLFAHVRSLFGMF